MSERVRFLACSLTILLSTFIAVSGRSQMVVDTSLTPEQLVKNVLVGKGVKAFNVSYTGDSVQVGYFDGKNDSIPFKEGIVMSSGACSTAVGPNDDGASSDNLGNTTGDPDLLDIAQQTNTTTDINDVAILEFDFVPQGDSVGFGYVFGSDEYPEWVGSSYNDVFGFFISGPGINGSYQNNAENMAQIPGTNDPISISDVNLTTNPTYYADHGNSSSSHGDGALAPYDTDPGWHNADGHTVSLIAKSKKVACQDTFHLSLKIGDGDDQAYNAWTFLQANSLSSNTIQVDVKSVSKDSTLVRGCTDAKIDLIRPDTAGKDTVHFDFKGDAVNGGDYTYVADSVIYQSGDSVKTLHIDPNTDSLGTGIDTLLFEVPTVNACGNTIIKDATIYIKDSSDYDLDVNAKDSVLFCPVDSVPVWANVTNGTPDYDYIWESTSGDSTTSDTAKLSGMTTDSLFVTAVDSCNATGMDTSVVESKWDSLSLDSITPDTVLGCYGNSSIDLKVSVSGGAKPYTYNWSNGGTDSSITISPDTTTLYTVTVTDSCFADQVTDSVLVEVPFDPIDIKVSTLSSDSSIAEGCTDGTFTFTRPDTSILDTLVYNISGDAINGADYDSIGDSLVYAGGDTSASVTIDALNDTVNENSADTVTVSAYFVDLCGDTVRSEASIYIEEDYQVNTITSDSVIFCPTDSVPFHVQGKDGNPPYSYSWSNGSNDDTTYLPGDANDTLTVTATDSCGKTSPPDTVVLTFDYDSLELSVVNDTTLACPGDTVDLSASLKGGHTSYNYVWMPQNVSSQTVSVHPSTSSGYEVSATDSCGNETLTDSVYVNVPQPAPVEAKAPDTTVRCKGDTIKLMGTADSGYGGYSYQWIGGPSDSNWRKRSYNDSVYVLQVTDKCGYSDKDSSKVRHPDYDPLQIEAGATDTVCKGEKLKIDADASGGAEGYTYQWTGDGEIKMMKKGKAEVKPKEGAYFEAKVTDYCGEEARDQVYLGVEDCQIKVPNVFSPNGDGKNDVFAFGNLEHYPGSSLKVYNRWGNLVYEAPDYQNDWRGGDLSAGTYYFVLKPSDPDTEIIKGEVTLFRDQK